MKMKLLTMTLRNQLVANGLRQEPVRGTEHEIDFQPVVKLFSPDGSATWLLSEILADDPDLAFGLCDLGMQCPELGLVRISELESVRGALGLPLERDLFFEADKTILEYAREAWTHGRIRA
ncbi:DUF2958 domain-containing protein [Luteolibacter pohnpeiensis]|uniref:DUF2958 domain-containing protein n=1 Tax=Luteolibacter pohnpeiensis TaxID=454153 RepID=A0A934SEJ8_9BACT|nr:DUF2958 domain-containing protein [Luteolibacter pohnpeiensis]MBK1884682.1 DUF2958 domain-containing protein [Luteolibacter pohnpeiensis]